LPTLYSAVPFVTEPLLGKFASACRRNAETAWDTCVPWRVVLVEFGAHCRLITKRGSRFQAHLEVVNSGSLQQQLITSAHNFTSVSKRSCSIHQPYLLDISMYRWQFRLAITSLSPTIVL
jgi:hypothetical protein